MINQEKNISDVKSQINLFFEVIENLKRNNVFRSDNYLGDLAEYICAQEFGIILSANKRKKSVDGKSKNGQKVQIKYHGSSTKTNVNLGDPTKYDLLYIVIGPFSKLRNQEQKSPFLIYEFSSDEIVVYKQKKGYYSGGKKIFKNKPLIIPRFFNSPEY